MAHSDPGHEQMSKIKRVLLQRWAWQWWPIWLLVLIFYEGTFVWFPTNTASTHIISAWAEPCPENQLVAILRPRSALQSFSSTYQENYISLEYNFEFAKTFLYVVFSNIYLDWVNFVEIIRSKLIRSQQISDRVVNITLTEIIAFLAFGVDEFVFNEKVLFLRR